MSGPTKGMVAGKPIQTGEVSKEYEEGFERTFGERKPTRGRFVYTSGGRPLPEPIQVDADWTNTVGRVEVVSDLYMDGVAATDGTDIGSRRKRREYMKANGLADADDFKGTWQKAGKQREQYRSGNFDTKERKEALARALTQRKRR